MTTTRPAVLELFCGLGGVAAALGVAARVVEAVDLDRVALGVYAHNFGHPVRVGTLESVTAGELAACGAELWTTSPPCQPYTRRGKGRDLDDPRAASLANLIARLPEARPRWLFLENVPGFAGSRAHRELRRVLDAAGYSAAELLLCPSELGWPNRRRRFYLVATRADSGPLLPFPTASGEPRPLAAFVDPAHHDDPALAVPGELARRYAGALSIAEPDAPAGDPAGVTACFTSAYGRSPVRSGSYLHLGGGRLRRFHPREVLALLGFPAAYRLPAELPVANGWRLAGNSLSLPAVRHALAALPPLAGLGGPGGGAGPEAR
jgi:site-specific DNA-cytosine methylase